MTLGAQLRRHVETGFSDQARKHGADLGKRAADMRARDPLAVQLLATFNRQARERAGRAQALADAGDRAGAVEVAGYALMAIENERRVRAAIAGDWDGTGEV